MLSKEDWVEVKSFATSLSKVGGIVYGGFVRDMVGESISFSDIDCFIKREELEENEVYHLSDEIEKLPNIKSCEWYDSPLDSYGDTYDSLTFELTFESGLVTELNLVFGDSLPTDTEYLDFDANSLILDSNGEIQSTLGKDKLPVIIKNIKNKEIILMRNDVFPDRIEHMKQKGYLIRNLEFI